MKISAALLGVILCVPALSAQSLQDRPPHVHGSFLVKGMVQKPERHAAPSVVLHQDTSQRMPQFRCPMTVAEADPKIDPKLAKTPPANVQFTIRAERPACAAR